MSHNSMNVSWSSVDVQDERSKPGLHALVRSIDKTKNTYVVETVIVQQYNRYSVDHDLVIDTSVEGLTSEDIQYHPNVKNYIKKHQIQLPVFGGKFGQYSFANNSTYGNPFNTSKTINKTSLDDEIIELSLEFDYLISSNFVEHSIEEKIDYVYGELLRNRKYTVSKTKIRSVLQKELLDTTNSTSNEDYDNALTQLELALADLQKYHSYKEIKNLVQQFCL